MRRRSWSGVVRLVMAAALVITGIPLVLPWLPWANPVPVPAAGVDAPLPQVAIDARDDLTPAQLQELQQRYGPSLRYNSPGAPEGKLLVLDVPVAEQEALLERLRKDPLVEAAAPVRRVQAYWTPNDPRFKEQWNMKLVGAEQAWDKVRGKGVTVAVIDTGVAYENDVKCYQAKDFRETHFTKGYDFVARDEHPNDDHGHGTHVAGTIAESTNNKEGVAGLAPEATIMPLKVLDAGGGGTSVDIANAVRWAADHGAQIINMSLGGPFPDPVMRNGCKYAAKKGVLIVCAAGNSFGGPVGYPAGFPECFAVSAVGPKGEIAPYSSVGRQVGIAAPGGDKISSERDEDGILQNTVLEDLKHQSDDYYYFQGTSMASPHVAGAAALVMSAGVKDAAEVRQILERAATGKKPKTKYGAGILNAAKAVDLAGDARRDSFLKLLFTLAACCLGVGVGAVRERLAPLKVFPSMPLGFALGLLGPDLIFGWLGFGSAFNIVLHSALIPLFLLWDADGPAVRRFVSMVALGVAVHLGWDAFHGHVPFAGILPAHGLPWLWVNTAIGAGVALVAWARSLGRE